MKKSILLFLLVSFLASCSSDGSRDIQIDEMSFIPYSDVDKDKDFSKVSSIFEVVPGMYKISWKLLDEVPQMKNFDVEINLKLRLKRHVDVLPEVFEKARNDEEFAFDCPFSIRLIDANGAKIFTSDYSIGMLSIGEWRKNNDHNSKNSFLDRDAYTDFFNFLKSDPGTEIEIRATGTGATSSTGLNFLEDVKKIQGIKCTMHDYDTRFEEEYGIIR